MTIQRLCTRFERTQDDPHHRQQQKRPTRERSGTPSLRVRRWFHIVFFHLLHYPEQCVGGCGGMVGRHKPLSLQSIAVLYYPRPLYAQASINYFVSTLRDPFGKHTAIPILYVGTPFRAVSVFPLLASTSLFGRIITTG